MKRFPPIRRRRRAFLRIFAPPKAYAHGEGGESMGLNTRTYRVQRGGQRRIAWVILGLCLAAGAYAAVKTLPPETAEALTAALEAAQETAHG